MIASSMWVDGPILWLLSATLFVLLLCLRYEREERRIRRLEADQPLAPVIPIERKASDHRHECDHPYSR